MIIKQLRCQTAPEDDFDPQRLFGEVANRDRDHNRAPPLRCCDGAWANRRDNSEPRSNEHRPSPGSPLLLARSRTQP
jgi:hypothetical protein